LRATAPLLGPEQTWTLIDWAPALVAAAADRLTAWADSAQWQSDILVLGKGELRLSVRFTHADLARELETALPPEADLVTASALFDLVSEAFIGRLAAAVALRGAALLSALTYNGELRWMPPSVADAQVLDAFNAHQRSDKGFGPAAGPQAGAQLRHALLRAGYAVLEGDSAWHLGKGDEALLEELVAGVAGAATQQLDRVLIEGWRALARTAAVVGHGDILALPRRVNTSPIL